MSEALESLLQCRDVKAFVKQFKELEQEWGEPSVFVKEAASYLAPRLYQPYYDEDTPLCLPGLAAAAETAPLFPAERAWWPCVQQAWYAANLRRRSPLDWQAFPVSSEGSVDQRWKRFEEAVAGQDFEGAFGLARGFCNGDFDFFRDRVLHLALHDSARAGLDFVYVNQILELMNQVGDGPDGPLLIPIVHFLAFSPRSFELARAVEEYAAGGAKAGVDRPLEADAYRALEHSLLFGEQLEEALEGAADTATMAGLDGLWDGLLLSGVEALSNARSGHWVWPMRAFLLAYLSRRRFREAEAGNGLKVALYCAAMLYRASLRTRSSETTRDLQEVARRLCPLDTFNTLRSVVSHSDPYASATAVYAILGMGEEKRRELFESLATLAAKNDGRMGRGYDLLLVRAAVDCHQNSKLQDKDRFLVGCAFFLGRLQKDYELFGAYGV